MCLKLKSKVWEWFELKTKFIGGEEGQLDEEEPQSDQSVPTWGQPKVANRVSVNQLP